MKLAHFPSIGRRRHLDLTVSPSVEMLMEIRNQVSQRIEELKEHPHVPLVTVTCPWDGAILSVLDDLECNLRAVSGNPEAFLIKVANACGVEIVTSIPEETDILIIDSALTGEALKEAQMAVASGIRCVLVHNTSPQLARVPKPMLSAAEAGAFLLREGYKVDAYQAISLEGGRRGLLIATIPLDIVAAGEPVTEEGTPEQVIIVDEPATIEAAPASVENSPAADAGPATIEAAPVPAENSPAAPKKTLAAPKKAAKKVAKKVANKKAGRSKKA
jgi:hypothetical protein